jgi:hypothetical protein
MDMTSRSPAIGCLNAPTSSITDSVARSLCRASYRISDSGNPFGRRAFSFTPSVYLLTSTCILSHNATLRNLRNRNIAFTSRSRFRALAILTR